MSASQVPTVAADYFGLPPLPDRHNRVTIAATFTPGRGWVRYPGRKRVSGSWVRKLRREGVTDLALAYGGRVADFTARELTR